MKKVLILYPSTIEACGIGTWLEHLSEALPLHGWDVTVGLTQGRVFHEPSRVESFRPALQTVWMNGQSGTEEGRIRAVYRTVLKEKPDLVILTCLDSAFEAVRRLRYDGHVAFRFIAVNHGNLPQQGACLLSYRDVVDMCVCVSRLSYDAMRFNNMAYDDGRLRHIPNAVVVQKKVALEKKEHQQRIGYVGRLDENKRASDLIPFFTSLHAINASAELWIAGDGVYRPKVQSLAEQYPDRIRYFGQLTKQELYDDFYPQLDVLVHFSPSEAWGYSIAEAMSFGVVPVASDFLGIYSDGLILEGKNGLVFPVGDTRRAAELVNGLLDQPSKLGMLGQNAGQHINSNFSIHAFGQCWAKAMEECLSLAPLQISRRPDSLKRKGRFHLSETIWESIRQIMGRQVEHASGGEEWPSFICNDADLIGRMAASLERNGKQDREDGNQK